MSFEKPSASRERTPTYPPAPANRREVPPSDLKGGDHVIANEVVRTISRVTNAGGSYYLHLVGGDTLSYDLSDTAEVPE